MSKNILIGVAAFGALVLVTSLALNGDESANSETEAGAAQEATTEPSAESLGLNVPIYPGTETLSVSDREDQGARFVTLSLQTEATIAEINDWYREALDSNGWSIKSDQNVGGYTIIQSDSGDNYTSMQARNAEEAGYAVITQQIRIGKRSPAE